MRALLSVYDKTGILDFARTLRQAGAELISTGGTWELLTREGHLPAKQVSEVTGFPEVLDGRVKTLHPAIHAGILARRDKPEHLSALTRLNIAPLDIVVVNLYPFEAAISRPGVTQEEGLENIDTGGPTMLRAAAKNYASVIVVVDPADYGWVGEKLLKLGLEERRRLAAKAFQHVAFYDTLVARWLRGREEPFPPLLTLAYRKVASLRYGENPHQQGALYAAPPEAGGLAGAEQLHGKGLSYNNILDADAAWQAVTDFAEPACVVVKHTNPCGLALGKDQAQAYRRAYEGDPVSAYGGIVGFNRPVTRETAEAMRGVFYEVVVAPTYEPDALEVLRKRRDLRILALKGAAPAANALLVRPVAGGALFQTPDALEEGPGAWKCVTARTPTPEEMADLAFAWKTVKHVKSNAIVLAKGQALAGMGAGQPNRLTSVHLALRAAGERARGCVLASDAFFPFADGLELAAQGGITAVVQPGGSIRDNEVIAAADKAGIAMLVTGVRHFRH
ncbi:MAG: bifunctional phosphoribosylaminoimidazolecarboxamide formyltransferase/IMP cyclohydrolase [Chloroflexi bacterium]|nr:bifunctional phosphoribosylaminoimidazolecarboxamide formyltransferase/IMP cyclohydrolase [Chloroflexota bacterium]